MPNDFEKAFSDARKKGLAQFSFNGKQFTTQLKDKQNNLLQLAVTDKINNESKSDQSLKFVSNYNTGLTQPELNDFYNWGVKRYGSHENILYEMGSYDLQGAYKDIKSGKIDFDPNNGHLPDTYKKPNHPSFSNESRYHSRDTPGGQWYQQGDQWKYYPSNYSIKNYGRDYIQQNFDNEPDTKVMWDNPVDF